MAVSHPSFSSFSSRYRSSSYGHSRLRLHNRKLKTDTKERATEVIEEAPAHLSGAVRFASVAGEAAPFQELLRYLEETYPRVHEHVLEIPWQTYARVFRIEGRDRSLLPALLCAHMDVVPAGDEGWVHPPFSGAVDEEFIWGRGSFDDKSSVIAILEAFERILRKGTLPQRTWYIALGDDEEVRGSSGAVAISSWFRNRESDSPWFWMRGGQ